MGLDEVNEKLGEGGFQKKIFRIYGEIGDK